MPQDVEGEAYDYPEHFLQKRVWHLDRRPISASQLERATALIKAAEKPIIVCGGGVRYSSAEKELLAFAEKYNIPVSETQAGKGLIDWKNPLNLGGIGVTGAELARMAGEQQAINVQNKDLLELQMEYMNFMIDNFLREPQINNIYGNNGVLQEEEDLHAHVDSEV